MVFVVFLLSTLCFLIIANYYGKDKYTIKRRVEQFIEKGPQTAVTNAEGTEKEKLLTALSTSIQSLAKMIRTSKEKQIRLEKDLDSAGIPLKVEEFIVIRIGAFGLLLVLSILFNVPLLLSIPFGFIGWMIPSMFVKKKKEARMAAFASQLPQALETMANGMKSGFSFMQAMQLVAKEMPDPIGIEFTKTIKEMNLGISLDTAFENLLQRVPNKDLEIVVTAVLIQRSTGGNLVTILETIHETISERVRMKDELKALTAQGRMSALVITLLPVAMGVLLHVMNPGYFTPMFSHPLGWVLLGGGVISGVLGWIFIQKVVTIEV